MNILLSFIRWTRRFAWVQLCVTLVGLTVLFAYLLDRHLALSDWLFFRYAVYFLVAATPLVAAFATGVPFVRWCTKGRWTTPEVLVVGTAVGIFGFYLGWSALGFLRAFHLATFLGWPLLLIVIGAVFGRPTFRHLLRFSRAVGRNRKQLTLLELSLFVLGVVGTVLVYAPILTPQNVAFDARWYHLPMAERYALEGGIVRYPEGWTLAGYPQLASILYSWGFSAPTKSSFDQIEIATHLEFLLFLTTLAGIPVLARRVLPKHVPLPRFCWAFAFFFPELFVYDSSVNGGADHVAAFWGVPLFLVTLRSFRSLDRRSLVILAIVVSAVLLTKYTASGLLVGPALALVGRTFWLLGRTIRKRQPVWAFLSRPLLLLGLLLVLTSPHWLKNLVWYDNPLFPLLAGVIPSRPWNTEATARLEAMVAGGWSASRDLAGVKTTLSQLAVFSFIPSDWFGFHRDLPMFGSLFTLLTPVLLFRRTKALIGLYVSANLGVLFWYWTFHQDRYLQAYLPWMAAAIAAVSALVWSYGLLARLSLVPLLVLQLAWGGDAPFLGSHAMIGQPLRATMDFLASGFAGRRDDRFVAYPDIEHMKQALPPGAVVLRHETQMHLGIGAATVGDWFQSGISWSHRPGPAGVHAVMKEYGITHVLWWTGKSLAFDSLGSDLAFYHYALGFTENLKRYGGYSLSEVPPHAPKGESLQVLYLGCDRNYALGMYDARQLKQIPYHGSYLPQTTFPRPSQEAHDGKTRAALARDADALVYNASCGKLSPSPERLGFIRAADRGADSLWVRAARSRKKGRNER